MAIVSRLKLMGHSFRGELMRVESAIYHVGMTRPIVGAGSTAPAVKEAA